VRGGTGTQARSFRPTLRRTSERTRRDLHSLHRARRLNSDTRASAPKRSTSPSTSICERCQQVRHSKAKAPRSITKRSVHLSTSRSFKSINAISRHLTSSLFVLKMPLWHSRLNSANGVLNSFLGRRPWGCVMSDPLKRARKYRDLAEECLRLSEMAPTAESKAEYRLIASHYVTLAKAQESLAASPVK